MQHTWPNTQSQIDKWKSKQLTFELVDLERVSESSLVFQAVLISFWLPMYFTIYRSQSPLASVPWAILSNPSLLASATLFLFTLLSTRGTHYNFYKVPKGTIKSEMKSNNLILRLYNEVSIKVHDKNKEIALLFIANNMYYCTIQKATYRYLHLSVHWHQQNPVKCPTKYW